MTCVYSHIVYTKNQQKLLIFLKPKKPRKNPIKPKKTQPLPYERSDWDRVFLGYTPPPIISESWDITIQYQIAYTDGTLNHTATLQTGDIRNNLKFVPSSILICPMF